MPTEQQGELRHRYVLGLYEVLEALLDKDFTAWEYAAKNRTEAYIGVVFTDMHGNPAPNVVCFYGLENESVYNVYRDNEYLGIIIFF